MREKKGMVALFALLATLWGTDIGRGNELIDPTRNLGGNEKQWGGLTLFSEPPRMEVHLDGKKMGRTPMWLQQVEATQHVLQIGGVKTGVQVKKGKTPQNRFVQGIVVKAWRGGSTRRSSSISQEAGIPTPGCATTIKKTTKGRSQPLGTLCQWQPKSFLKCSPERYLR